MLYGRGAWFRGLALLWPMRLHSDVRHIITCVLTLNVFPRVLGEELENGSLSPKCSNQMAYVTRPYVPTYTHIPTYICLSIHTYVHTRTFFSRQGPPRRQRRSALAGRQPRVGVRRREVHACAHEVLHHRGWRRHQ